MPVHRAREVTGFTQDDDGVDVALSDGTSLRARFLVGCDGGRSVVRKAAGIDFPGWDPTTSWLIAEVAWTKEPAWGFRNDAVGTHGIGKLEDGRARVVLTERHVGAASEPTAEMSGLDVHYDLGEGHSLLGRRMPDLDLATASGPRRVFSLLHEARPVLLNLGDPGGFDITPWADRVRSVDATYAGSWDLPVIGAVAGPSAVLIRPDGYVAWVGDRTQAGLADALTAWFGPPA